jgi:Flp pilus assembly pilin Flp
MQRRKCVRQFGNLLWELAKDESGQDLVEYALVIAFIALAALATIRTFAQSLITTLTGIGSRITSAV